MAVAKTAKKPAKTSKKADSKPVKKATPDEVWALFRESGQRQAKIDEQISKQMEEARQRQARVDEQMEEARQRQAIADKQLQAHIAEVTESIKALEKTVDRVTKNVGGLNRSVGELVETLIAAHLWEKFPQYDLKRAYQRLPIYDEHSNLRSDIDILLVNTSMCMAVEVKRALDRKDEVEEHLKRMELIRQYPPLKAEIEGKELLGAMAGGVVDPVIKDYIYSSGFFVLELTGESVQLIQPPKGFEPKKW